ncbi:MAG: hypothetical protein E7633_03430 [Ruminococcaceae bacterium]|nr:hypothetical protein [Oscillospiraceae bacterium]
MKALSLNLASWISCKKQVTTDFGNQWRPIKNNRNIHIEPDDSTVYFKKDIVLNSAPENAAVTVSGLGIFELFVNGVRVGNISDGKTVYDELKPGWTEYRKRVLSFTYDISSLLKKGENILGIVVTRGWWSGRISFGTYCYKKMAAIAAFEIEFADGEKISVNTDESWQSTLGGPIRFADIYDGEYFDARIESPVVHPEFSKWENCEIFDGFDGEVSPAEAPFIRVREHLERRPFSAVVYEGTKENGSDFGEINTVLTRVGANCEKLTLRKGQTLVLDYRQNLVGRPHISIKAPAGVMTEIYCAEFLNDSGLRSRANDGPKGSAYIENYRSALARMVYITKGDENGEEFFPTHVFYGFRYLEVTCDGDVEIDFVKAEIIGSETEEISTFECSNEEVNKLFSNIIWGQRGNYLSVPTDCPQRDERLGWTGDTQVFCGAAAYNANVNGFFRKWARDVRDTQRDDGSVGDVIPSVLNGDASMNNASWGDATLIVPYKIYLFFGDRSLLEDHYDSMIKYMEKLSTYPLGGRPNAYADWLSYEPTSREYISFTTYANDADLMSKIAAELSEKEGDRYDLDAKKYANIFADAKEKFNERYVKDGDLTERTQCTYLIALRFGLVDGEVRENCIKALVGKIKSNGYKLSTGFVGTGMLSQTLSEVGEDSLAYSLLLQSENPSWIYSLRQGATTVWERWNSYTLETGFGDVNMNSYNHYAYGAVSEWMFESMAGIAKDPAIPAFRHFFLSPRPDLRTYGELPEGQERITFVKASYNSASGLIKSAWDITNGKFTLNATVPEGTSATVIFPLIGESDTVLVNSVETAYKKHGNSAVFELTAGDYTIQ